MLNTKRLALALSLCDHRARVAVVRLYASRFDLDAADLMRTVHREMRQAFPQPHTRKA